MSEYGFGGRLRAEFPSQINVDVTQLCNLNCVHCYHEEFTKSSQYAAASLDASLNKKLIDEVSNHGKDSVEYIRYSSDGEPLLHKDIIKMLRYACSNSQSQIALTTNGTLLNESMVADIIEMGLNQIDISIDAASEETYRQIRRKGDFHTVCQNVLRLLSLKNRLKSDIKVVVSFVNQPANTHETEKFETYWKDHGVDYVVIRKLHSVGNALPSVADKLRNAGISRRPCLYPWERIILQANGCLSFCPNLWESYDMFDFKAISIADAWQSPKYNILRREHLRGVFSNDTICADCPDWINTSWPWEGRSYADMMQEFKKDKSLT
jgi:sulfatase maturation enzyme AslB (radical SAM superfamily)